MEHGVGALSGSRQLLDKQRLLGFEHLHLGSLDCDLELEPVILPVDRAEQVEGGKVLVGRTVDQGLAGDEILDRGCAERGGDQPVPAAGVSLDDHFLGVGAQLGGTLIELLDGAIETDDGVREVAQLEFNALQLEDGLADRLVGRQQILVGVLFRRLRFLDFGLRLSTGSNRYQGEQAQQETEDNKVAQGSSPFEHTTGQASA